MHNNEISVKLLNFSRKIQCILTITLWVLLAFGFDKPYVAGLTVIAAIVHECGHVFCARLILRSDFSASSRLSGPRIRARKISSYSGELLLLFGGVLSNLTAFLASLPFLHTSEYILCFAILNLATALSNLLPLSGHDGYGLIRVLLEKHEAPRWAFSALHATSALLGTLGCIFALFLMERVGEGYWLFGIFYFSLVCDLFERQTNHF